MQKLTKISLSILTLALCTLAIWYFFSRPSEVRLIEFAKDVSLGELWVIEDVNCFTCGNGEKLVGEAQGLVKVGLPRKHWFVKLVLAPDALMHLDLLHAVEPGAIEAISFAGTNVNDADLSAISNFRLRDLDLSETSIRGIGLSHLKARADWLSISLQSNRELDPQSLDALLGQNQISIDLWRSNLDNQQFICNFQGRMCDAVKPARCYIRINGARECTSESSNL